jgi:predicted TIM-barrel fold metal-dependent hydrolase
MPFRTDVKDLRLGSASRREFIASVAAAGALSLAPGLSGTAVAATSKVRRVDMHHHFLPQRYMAEEHERTKAEHGNSAMLSWTAAGDIEALDKAGVDFAVGSISTPGVWYGDVALGRRLAREWNEAAAETVRDHPTRFGFFAPVPLPDTEGTLKEIDYAYGTLKADGINFLSNYDGKWLGDPAFAPVMEELNRRKSLVYVHPTFSPCCTANMVPGLVAPTLEFPYDTTRTIVSLITSGTTTRFPDIRWIFSHGGGALAGVYGRVAGLGNSPAFKAKVPAGVPAELQKLHYDTASLSAVSTLPALLKIVPASQVLLGSDYPLAGPPPTDVMVKRAVEEFEAMKPSPALRQAIERDNAVKLIPRIATI